MSYDVFSAPTLELAGNGDLYEVTPEADGTVTRRLVMTAAEQAAMERERREWFR